MGGNVQLTSAEFSEFMTPSTPFQYQMHATSLSLVIFRPTPLPLRRHMHMLLKEMLFMTKMSLREILRPKMNCGALWSRFGKLFFCEFP